MDARRAELKQRVQNWTAEEKRTYLKVQKALGCVDSSGEGFVCAGTSSDVIKVDEWIIDRLMSN